MAQSQIALTPWPARPMPVDGAGLTPRELWYRRLQAVANAVRPGPIHAACALFSVLLLAVQVYGHLQARRRRNWLADDELDDQDAQDALSPSTTPTALATTEPEPVKRPAPGWSALSLWFAVPQTIAAAAAFSCSVVLAVSATATHSTHSSSATSWGEAAVLGYVLLLCVARLVLAAAGAPSLAGCVYHHTNALGVALPVLMAVQQLLPLAVIGSPTRVGRLAVAKLAAAACVPLAAFAAPRGPRRPEGEGGASERKATEETDRSCVAADRLSPEESCSWLSYYVSYEWLTPVILRGCRRDLVLDDLPSLPSYDQPLSLLARMGRQRGEGAGPGNKTETPRRRRTLWALMGMFRSTIGTILVWGALTAAAEYVAPLALFQLLAYLDEPAAASVVVHPFVWIGLLFAGPMLRSVCYQQSIFRSTRLLVLWHATVVQEVLQCMLGSRMGGGRRAGAAKKTETQGGPGRSPGGGHAALACTPDTLITYDADMIANCCDMFYAFTASALSTALAMAFLFRILGWPSLLGVAVLLGLTPLPAVLSRRVSRLHKRVMAATDARLARVAACLHAVRTLKFFAWEPLAAAALQRARAAEQQRLWQRNLASMLVALTGDMLSLVSLLVMVVGLVVLTPDRPLRAPMAFTALAITETLRAQYVWLAKVAQWVAQGRESLQRLDAFLDAAVPKQRHPEGAPAFRDAVFALDDAGTAVDEGPGPSVSDPALGPALDQEEEEQPFSLSLHLVFREHGLNVVTGATGSGKTSLLLSLLGETRLVAGAASCPADVAYVPQTPWLQNTTIQQNILFYSAYDARRYQAVLDACDLAGDLAQLAPHGDQTPVGERGSALSGGQKQRVALARALYSTAASTLLLDDVFSALDAHTTARVWERCFASSGGAQSWLLAGRTVILVTHLQAAIDDADFVVHLEGGRVRGTREGRRSQGGREAPGMPAQNERVPRQDESLQQADHHEDHRLENQIQRNHQQDPPATPDTEEKHASGRVPRSLVAKYVRLFGGRPQVLLTLACALLVQLAYFSITLWLSVWTSHTPGPHHPAGARSRPMYLLVHVATVLAFVGLQLLNNYNFQRGGWRAAQTMHARLVAAVLAAPVAWFDRTPVGQILTRFGLDTQSLDAKLVDWVRMTLDNGLRFLLRLASIASILPVFALPAAVCCSCGLATGEMYSRAEIGVKRLVAVRWAPVLSHLHDAAAGLPVIRGRGPALEAVFQRRLAARMAAYMRAAEAQYNCNRWVSVRSDLCAATIAASAGAIAYGTRSASAGLVGFSLTNAIGLSQTILALVRNLNELEVELNSFQRIADYADTVAPEEAPADVQRYAVSQPPPAPSWPTTGQLTLRHVSVHYDSPDADAGDSDSDSDSDRDSAHHTPGPAVLHDINLVVRPGERIAVVGRTGSGKSTLARTLLRASTVLAPGGQIRLDGVDIARVPRDRLRHAVCLIPQDTMLFAGDVRTNVDPAGRLDDAALQAILDATFSSSGSSSLEAPAARPSPSSCLSPSTPVAAGGTNLSSGQRQLLGLARALARRPRARVVILDEATAAVDHATDQRMQQLIRTGFQDATVLTIAHRLRTVLDYDRVLVLARGRVVEMGSPAALVAQKKGVFWDMLQATGEGEELVATVEAGEK